MEPTSFRIRKVVSFQREEPRSRRFLLLLKRLLSLILWVCLRSADVRSSSNMSRTTTQLTQKLLKELTSNKCHFKLWLRNSNWSQTLSISSDMLLHSTLMTISSIFPPLMSSKKSDCTWIVLEDTETLPSFTPSTDSEVLNL